MNKKARKGTHNTRFLKWHKALILAFAATLSFQYQPTLEAMDRTSISSETTVNTEEQIKDILYQCTQDLAKALDISLNKYLLFGIKTQQELQPEISKKLKQKDFKIETGDNTQEELFCDLLQTDNQLDTLLEQQRGKNLEEQILKLHKSYQQVMTRMVLTRDKLAGFYLLAPCFTLDTEGEDQAKKPSMWPSGIKTQLSDEDIINITRLATLYLATILYIDIEQQQPNNSAKHQSTNENFLEKIGQQRQKIHNMLNRYMTNNQTETQDLFDLNTPKYKETDLLQQAIQQQISILKKPQSTTADINILKKQIKTLHIILKLLHEIPQKETDTLDTTNLETTITIYQQTLSQITPRSLEFIKTIITEAPKNQFATISFTNDENKKIQQFSQSTTDLLIETFTQTLNTYMGNDKRTNNQELLQATKEELGTKAFVQQEVKQPLVNEQIITEPINLLTTLIEKLNSIIQNSSNYLGVESTILTLNNQLGKITEQYEEAAKQQEENPEATTERKNELAQQAIETIINFLHIMEQTAEEGANKDGIKQTVAAYTQLGILLQKQQEERKMQEEEKKRQEEAIITNLKSTTDKLSKIINILLQ